MLGHIQGRLRKADKTNIKSQAMTTSRIPYASGPLQPDGYRLLLFFYV